MYIYKWLINIIKKHRKLRKKARERYENLSKEEKEKRQKKTWDRYKNLSDEVK